MKSATISDEIKCNMFLLENANWQSVIQSQIKEIPAWKNKLTNDDKTQDTLCRQLFRQLTQMQKLEEDLQQQQERLTRNCETQHLDDIESFCMQDILREQIKVIEKTYIDLRCNLLSYLSNRVKNYVL